MKQRRAKLRRHADLLPAQDGDVLVSSAIGPRGELVALWSSPDGADALSSKTVVEGWATFPDTRTPRPASAHVAEYSSNLSRKVPIADLPVAHPHIQPLPDGGFLVVGARCLLGPEGPESNAIVYDALGEPVRKGVLGDGIEHVLTTENGEIWVGYFDEGVYGNFGWGPGLTDPEPVGSHGLVRFTAHFDPLWRYPFKTEFGTIDDCYALNVTGETAWACYYSDFPVVRIDEDRILGWRNDVRGARALIVDGDTVALVGGYRDDHDRVIVGRLGDADFVPQDNLRMMLPGDAPLTSASMIAGRGPELSVVAGQVWYKIEMTDLPT